MLPDFLCPRCRKALRRGSGESKGIWVCDACGGRLARLADLRRFVEKGTVQDAWNHAHRTEEAGPPCALCARETRRVTLEGVHSKIEVEVCRLCQAVWLDGGEITALPAAANPPPDKDLTAEARLALATLELERIRRSAEGDPWDGEPPENGWKWVPAALGLPIEIDDELPLRRPWVTWSVATAMTVFTAAVLLLAPEQSEKWAWIPAETFERWGVTLITGFLLHGGWWHLVGNAYFLLVCGDDVEEWLGWVRYLGLILAAELASDAGHLLASDASIPVVGASGAISGVLAYYAVRFPQRKIGLFHPAFLARSFRLLSAPAWFMFVLWTLQQSVLLAFQVSGNAEVSAGGHLGGAAVGFTLGLCGRGSQSPVARASTS